MSLIRHNWPIVLIAILALMAIGAGDGHASKQHSEANSFAMQHYQRCMLVQPDAAASCATRTVQLASQLGGLEFGDRVAAELR